MVIAGGILVVASTATHLIGRHSGSHYTSLGVAVGVAGLAVGLVTLLVFAFTRAGRSRRRRPAGHRHRAAASPGLGPGARTGAEADERVFARWPDRRSPRRAHAGLRGRGQVSRVRRPSGDHEAPSLRGCSRGLPAADGGRRISRRTTRRTTRRISRQPERGAARRGPHGDRSTAARISGRSVPGPGAGRRLGTTAGPGRSPASAAHVIPGADETRRGLPARRSLPAARSRRRAIPSRARTRLPGQASRPVRPRAPGHVPRSGRARRLVPARRNGRGTPRVMRPRPASRGGPTLRGRPSTASIPPAPRAPGRRHPGRRHPGPPPSGPGPSGPGRATGTGRPSAAPGYGPSAGWRPAPPGPPGIPGTGIPRTASSGTGNLGTETPGCLGRTRPGRSQRTLRRRVRAGHPARERPGAGRPRPPEPHPACRSGARLGPGRIRVPRRQRADADVITTAAGRGRRRVLV